MINAIAWVATIASLPIDVWLAMLCYVGIDAAGDWYYRGGGA